MIPKSPRRHLVTLEEKLELKKKNLHSIGKFLLYFSYCNVGERGDSWHIFHVIIFHFFCVVKLNVRARMASNTFGLQPDLHTFHAVCKE
jgi:hypothetical protein